MREAHRRVVNFCGNAQTDYANNIVHQHYDVVILIAAALRLFSRIHVRFSISRLPFAMMVTLRAAEVSFGHPLPREPDAMRYRRR